MAYRAAAFSHEMLAPLLFAVAHAHSLTGGTVAFDVHRQVNASLAKHPNTAKTAAVNPGLNIGGHTTWYGVALALGTPPQNVTVQIDTGSSDLWVAAPFNPLLSATFKGNESDPFSITYGDGSGAQGYFAKDKLQLSEGVAVQGANFAYAEAATSYPPVFGIGYVSNEAGAHYDNIPVQLKKQGFTSALAYSLYLGDSTAASATGQVLFGGVDHSKYDGQLYTVPVTQPRAFFVSLDGIYHGDSAVYSTPQEVLLDSGTTELILPFDMVGAIVRAIDPQAPDVYVGASVQCSSLASSRDALDFDFSGARISVPVQNLVDPNSLNADGTIPSSGECYLGVQPTLGYPYILGDRFLLGAYVVYDLDNHEISLANAAHGRSPQIEAIEGSVPRAVDAPNYKRADNGTNSTSSANGATSTAGATSAANGTSNATSTRSPTSGNSTLLSSASAANGSAAAPPAIPAPPPFALPFAPAPEQNATGSGAASLPQLGKARNGARRRVARLRPLGIILLFLA